MPSKPQSDNRENVLAALKQWASEASFEKHPYVINLISAISTNSNLPFWATISPFDYLPRKKIQLTQRRKVLSYLGLLRNTLIFTPVALTWTAIGKATSAYQIYNLKNPNNLSNFLDFWQNGYGILSDSWTIGKVAAADAIIIGVIISLIIITQLLTVRIVREESLLQEAFDLDRFNVGLEISQLLFEKRDVSDGKLKSDLAQARNLFKDSLKQMNSLTREVTRANKASAYNKLVSELKKYNGKRIQ